MAAVVIAGTAGRRAGAAVLLVTLAGLLATLLSPGLSAVHRWIDLGPVQLNAAEILLPPAVVALAVQGPGRRWLWADAVAIGVGLVVQPDASQATTFGGAVITMLMLSSWTRAWRWGGAAVAAVAMFVAWLRPDPLAPVPEVEQIFQLAWGLAPSAAILAGAVLAATALTPAFLAGREARISRTAAVALIVYFAISAMAPALGAFPEPLVGMGVSPILGWWLGAGLLAAAASGRLGSSPTP